MRSRVRRFCLAAGLLASAAAIGVESAAGAPSGTVLRPGEARIVAIGVPPAGAEEWEAFLSVDGGRSFPVRITPHLPIAERSFPWTVPALPTAAARIRFRFGVGGVEQEFLCPDRFAIGASPGPAFLSGSPIANSPAPGEDDTLAWVERRGDRTLLVFAGNAGRMAPQSRWSAATRVWRWIPRQGPRAAPASLALPGARPGLPRPFSPRIAPRGRSLASVSRLNI